MARGTLRIYLGAAAGVGKTFAMLNEGRRRRDYGEDVVVGFVETHGRQKTAAQVGDLEVVPRTRARVPRRRLRGDGRRRGARAQAAGRARRRARAHERARARGTRSAGRTSRSCSRPASASSRRMNVQHLESLNDVVEQITGVEQRETIPDEVVRRADEIQLVDLTPLALRNRLARGDVYPAERIDAALANYFRPGQPHRAPRARPRLARRPGRRGPRRVPRAARDRRAVGDARARARRADRLAPTASGSSVAPRAIAQRSKGDLVGVHVIPQDGLAAPSAALLERAARAPRGARRHVPRGRRRRRRRGAARGRALAERDADRHGREPTLALAAADARLGDRHASSASRASASTSTSSATPSGRSEDAFVVPRTRRPAALPRDAVLLGFALAGALRSRS